MEPPQDRGAQPGDSEGRREPFGDEEMGAIVGVARDVPAPPGIFVVEGDVVDPRADATLAADEEFYSALAEQHAEQRLKNLDFSRLGFVNATEDEQRRVRIQQRRRELAMNHPIPISFLVQSLRERLQARSLHNELFFYVPFLIAFLFFFIIGQSVEQAYWASVVLGGQLRDSELPYKQDAFPLRPGDVEGNHIGRSFRELRDSNDWHAWLQGNVVEFVWNGGVERDATFAAPQNGFIEGGNLPVGALRVRQIRVTNSSCTLNDDFVRANAPGFSSCYGPLSFLNNRRNVDRSALVAGSNVYPFVECAFTGRVQSGNIGMYPCSGNIFDVPFNVSRNEARARLETLRGETNDGGVDFFDARATRLLVVEFVVYHPAFDTFTAVKAMTEISRGGKLINTVWTQAFRVWTPSQRGHTIYFIVFYVLGVMPWVAKFCYDLVTSARAGKTVSFATSLGTLVEFANLGILLIVLVVRCIWWSDSVRLGLQLPGDGTYEDELDRIAWLYLLQVYLNAFNTIAIFLKLLKYVQLNPRLNLVSRTLVTAKRNLLGVLVIFTLIVLAFSMTGVLLFSNGMEKYRDLEYSVSSLMLQLIGHFDYDAMRNENRFLAGVFFWSFTLLGLFLMLNFIIGVISSAFNEELRRTAVEPLEETLTRFVDDATGNLQEFLSSPLQTVQRAFKKRATKFGEVGRFTTLLRAVEAYRMSLPIGISKEQLDAMDFETRWALYPDPAVTRADLSQMIESVLGPAEAERCHEWLTPQLLDRTWLDVHHRFKLTPDDGLATQFEETSEHIHEATHEALRWVLGLDVDDERRRADPEVQRIQELFSAGAENMRHMSAVASRLGTIEVEMARLLHRVSVLDKEVTQLLS